jgi:DNA-binding CsgD family transcriptional regulator
MPNRLGEPRLPCLRDTAPPHITTRQQQAFDLYSKGFTLPEIAQRMQVRYDTAKSHVAIAKQILDLKTQVEAVLYANNLPIPRIQERTQ